MTYRSDITGLTGLNDETLVARFQAGDDRAVVVLVQRYRRVARSKGRSYFLVGADAEDIEQEGLIGLYKAARDFRDDRKSSFRAFAELCVTRQVISAVKAATRQKHGPLNHYVSLSGGGRGDDDADHRIEALLGDHRVSDPAEEVVSHETIDQLRCSLTEALSGLEVDVLRRYVSGESYQEIGDQLGRHVKSIDNALQRIKRKLDHQLHDEDELPLAG